MEAKFTYVGIRVKNMKKSVEFYTKLLGMKDQGHSRIEVAKGDVAFLQSNDGEVGIELNHYDSDSPFNTKYVVGEGLDHLAFGVKDLDAALRQAKKLGYKFLKEVRTEKSRWAYIQDPNGIWVELFKTSQ
ncbi:MAG TPA: VOC family protein [Nitrososphaerales archaeon]|nr:VOC family protein [Nitrososphaerales archaeon]